MSEQMLVATINCPKCLSKNTKFERFRGNLIQPDKSKPAEGVIILAEVHICQSCKYEFERDDGPWIGLELAAWHQAMKHALIFDKVYDYTNYIKRRTQVDKFEEQIKSQFLNIINPTLKEKPENE